MPIPTEQERLAREKYAGSGTRRYRSRRNRSGKKRHGGFLILLFLAVVGVVAAAIFIIPLLENPAVMLADTRLEIEGNAAEELTFSWTPGKHAAEYRVVISDRGYGAAAGTVLVDRICKKPVCTVSAAELSSCTTTRPVHVEITARKFFDFLKRPSKNGEEVPPESQALFDCYLSEPGIRDQRGSVDVEQQSVRITWNGWEGDSYALYLRSEDGNRELLREIRSDGSASEELTGSSMDLTLYYGANGDFTIPGNDRRYTIEAEISRDGGNTLFYGPTVEIASFTRDDLMSKTISLTCEELENNRYRLHWNNTGSIAYRVEVKRPGREAFEKIDLVDGHQELTYEPEEHFRACREYTFRVIGITNGDELVGDQIDAKFAEIYGAQETEDAAGLEVHRAEGDNTGTVTVFTDPCALYASIWPVKKLDLYAGADKKQIVGNAQTGECLCVLGEDRANSLFRVRVGDQEGYIDSSYCMINLPDYLGELCQYDIPNSYASIYMVHDFYIPDVTGGVVPGYEDVLLDDGTFLVPLLYPVAERLVDAAESLMEAGYRIEINDSFRPYCATRYIYDETNEILNWQLPETPFWEYRTTLQKYISNGRVPDEVPDEARAPMELELEALAENGEEQTDAGVQDPAQEGAAAPAGEAAGGAEPVPDALPEGSQEQGEGAPPAEGEAPLLEDTEDNRNTYYWEMTNGTWHLGSFLAATASRHNLGVAMDMTIVSLSDPSRPLAMQSQMHDLSYNSAMSLNNGNADILKEHLTRAGFAMISSEWWHFQDNEVTSKYHPPIVEKGISIKGWKKDDRGWRYLDEKGRPVIDEVATIDGQSYIFDLQGYTDR